MMSQIWPYVYIMLGLGVLYLLTWLSFAPERSYRRTLRRRDAMDDAKFVKSFYASGQVPSDIPIRLRPIYANFFGIDVTKLRPSDRPPEISELDTIDLVCAIENEFDISISDSAAEQIDGSFDSIVQFLVSKKLAS